MKKGKGHNGPLTLLLRAISRSFAGFTQWRTLAGTLNRMTINEMTRMTGITGMIWMTEMTCMIRMTINEMTWMAGMTGMAGMTCMIRMNRMTINEMT